MKNKILLTLVAVIAVAAGVMGLSAFEAHIINVTAHIENALDVDTTPIAFGTVFPQEYLQRNFNIALSDSFNEANRVDDVEYKIVQKSKCKADDPQNPAVYAPVDRSTHECPQGYTVMLSLCRFLSRTTTDKNDVGVPSYYDAEGPSCVERTGDEIATGRLSKQDGDIADDWVVDLKVPPVAGTIAQDWPAGCPTIPENNKDYGCDLWVEVTGISTNYIDRIDIGDAASMSLHNAASWFTDPGIGNYGGRDGGQTIAMVRGGGTECSDQTASAEFTLDTGNLATKLNLRHLDGISILDSFDVLINDAVIGHYTDDGTGTAEIWKTSTFALPDNLPSSIINVKIVNTDAPWNLCGTYGQVAFNWAEVE